MSITGFSKSSESRAKVMKSLTASIVITTRNRRDDILQAIESCFSQDYQPLEVLVFDDASEDGTSESIRFKWPEARVFFSSERVGLIVNRSRSFREAKGDIIFSIDDDAYFSNPGIVSQIISMFENDSSIGAVAIPYIEPLNRLSLSSLKASMRDKTRIKAGDELSGYIGCAHAVRRDVALALGGYRDFFVHQGEERDFCLRLRQAGWRIVYGDSDYIVHMVSPKRDHERVSFYGARNQILFDMLNIPLPAVLFRLVWDPIAMVRYRFAWSSLPLKLRAITAGFTESIRRIHKRQPVSRATYRRYRSLPGHGPEPWEGPVPPPCTSRGCHPPDQISGVEAISP